MCFYVRWVHIFLGLYPPVGLCPSFSFTIHSLGFKVYFLEYKYCYPSFFFLFHLHEISFSIPFLLVSVHLSIWDRSLRGSIYMGLVFLFIQLLYVFSLCIFYWLCYYSFPNFLPFIPPPPCTPQPSSISWRVLHGLMSMGCTCKFFEFSVSYTIFDLSLSILCLLIMLLLPCTFPPYSSLPALHWNLFMWCPFLWFCSCSSCLFSFYCFFFLLFFRFICW